MNKGEKLFLSSLAAVHLQSNMDDEKRLEKKSNHLHFAMMIQIIIYMMKVRLKIPCRYDKTWHFMNKIRIFYVNRALIFM